MKTKPNRKPKPRKPRGKIYRASLPARVSLLHLDSSHLDETNQRIPVAKLKITDFSADIQRQADLADTVIFVSDFGDARSLKHQISDENNAILRAGAEAFAAAIAEKPLGGSPAPVKLGDVLPPETKTALEQEALKHHEVEPSIAPETEAEGRERMETWREEATNCATRSSFPVNPGETMEESIIRAGCDPEKVLTNSRAQAEKWVEIGAGFAAATTTEKTEVPAEEPGQSTLCSRAREAYEAEQAKAREARHKWVINTFGGGSWEGIKHNESDDTYSICGYTWRVIYGYLDCVDKVIDVNGESYLIDVQVSTLVELGAGLKAIEERIAEIKAIPKKPTMTFAAQRAPSPTFLSKLWDLLNTPIV